MPESNERRDPARVPVELRVEYRRLNSFFADYAKNIAHGGTFLRTEAPLAAGTEVVVVLKAPRMPESLRLQGEVMWVVAVEDATVEHPAGMGIRFRYHDAATRRATEETVERLLHAELGERITQRLLEEPQQP